MRDKPSVQDIHDWAGDANPEELVQVASKLVNKIGQLSPQYQDQFLKNVDQTTLRIFDKERTT